MVDEAGQNLNGIVGVNLKDYSKKDGIEKTIESGVKTVDSIITNPKEKLPDSAKFYNNHIDSEHTTPLVTFMYRKPNKPGVDDKELVLTSTGDKKIISTKLLEDTRRKAGNGDNIEKKLNILNSLPSIAIPITSEYETSNNELNWALNRNGSIKRPIFDLQIEVKYCLSYLLALRDFLETVSNQGGNGTEIGTLLKNSTYYENIQTYKQSISTIQDELNKIVGRGTSMTGTPTINTVSLKSYMGVIGCISRLIRGSLDLNGAIELINELIYKGNTRNSGIFPTLVFNNSENAGDGMLQYILVESKNQ